MAHITTDKQVILIRTDLKMNPGKIGAQCAHASWLTFQKIWTEDAQGIYIPKDSRTKDWFEGKYTKTVLAVSSEQELRKLYNQAVEAGVLAALVMDSGLTTFNYVPTLTAAGIGPDQADKINTITGHLKPLR